jgi:hypothetical protein
MSECFAISLCAFRHGREIAQPYRSWGLKIFATFHSASKIFSVRDVVAIAGKRVNNIGFRDPNGPSRF